jgi:hypothetical protein
MSSVDQQNLPAVLTTGIVEQPTSEGKFCSWFGTCSATLGCWTRRHAKKMITFLFACLVIYLLMILIAVEIEENNIAASSGAAAYITAMYHWKCKGHGCGGRCPHSDKSDPRVFVSEQTEYIGNLLDSARDHLSNEIQTNASQFPKFDKAEFKTKLNQMIKNETDTVDNIFKLQLAARLIDNEFSNCDVNSGTYTAQNHLIALSNAADINKAILIISTLARMGTVYKYTLDAESAKEKSSISNFDKHHDKWIKSATALHVMSDLTTEFLADSSDFNASQNAVLQSVNAKLELKGEKIMAHVLALAKTKDSIADMTDAALRHYKTLSSFRDAHAKAYKKEPFNNAMPGKVSADQATALIEQGDYNQVMIKTALEPSVVSNHREFAKKRADHGNLDINQLSVRDDPNDVIPWVAYSRPSYTKSDGITPADVPNKAMPLSSIPSDNTDAMRARPLKFAF